jgi:HD-like signal output (HDOD) protein
MLNVAGRTKSHRVASARQLPSLIREIIGLVHDPNANVARLAAALAGSQTSTDSGRRELNFPLFGRSTKTYNIGLATVLLGFKVLKETVTRVVVNAVLQKLTNTLSHCEGFWNHAIAVAVTARRVAEKHHECNPDDAFIAGLFHGIGTIVLHDNSEGGRQQGEETSWSSSEIESASVIAARWGLPLEIVEAIRYCRAPWLARVNTKLTAAVHIADVLCHRLSVGTGQPHYLDEFDESALETLQIRREDLNAEQKGKLGELVRSNLSEAPRFDSIANGVRDGFVSALEKLPEQQKLVVALRYYEDLSFADIAQVMALTEFEVAGIHGEAVQGLRTVIVHST